MRILAGGPTHDTTAEYFKASRDTIKKQRTTHEVDVRYIVDQAESDYEVSETNHTWSNDSIERVARMRQDFLDLAEAEDYDAALFVDTDLILAPDTVEIMTAVDAPIVFGVFWTQWENQELPLPQVWDIHPYGYDWMEHPTDPSKRVYPTVEGLARGKEFYVNGGGACTLIHKEAFGKARYHPLLPGMPDLIWGEDRHFCIRAAAHDLNMVATGKVKIAHLYAESHRDLKSINHALELTGWTNDQG